MKIERYDEASEIWLNYKDGLYAYLLKRVKDHTLAEELTQQSLMKVYTSCCSGRDINNVKSWLFQIAHNLMIDHHKKSSKIVTGIPEQAEENNKDEYIEAAKWIEPLIELLPEKYAHPLKLADIKKQKQDDIATELGLSLTATKSRIQRARKMLKDKIQECCLLELNDKGQLEDFAIRPDCEPLQD